MRVAHVSLCAQLPHLFGAHPAAAAAVKNQADSRGALGGSGGAGALFAALLSRSLSPAHGHEVRQTHPPGSHISLPLIQSARRKREI